MIFSNPRDVARAKRMTLEAFKRWKVEQLLPTVQQWADEGSTIAEIERRLDGLQDEVEGEAIRALSLITVLALKDGACEG